MTTKRARMRHYRGPAGGWGSVHSLIRFAVRDRVRPIMINKQLLRQNKPKGFICVSCAWAKPAKPHVFEYCENGAKATFWELGSARADRAFFESRSVTELLGWSDHELESSGRLTEPMRYDADRDRYVPISWSTAFEQIGAALRKITPKQAVFYTSGRASLEASYMYALFARMFGCNNLPDSSNMCHESTSVGLPRSLGVPVGTIQIEDFEHTDCILSFGQNVGTNSPRMLHQLQQASDNGAAIITFNPLRERGWERFINPQDVPAMLSRRETPISSSYLQLRAGGDVAAVMGLCKALLEIDDEARAAGRRRVLDTDFIDQHTKGFKEFARCVRDCEWSRIEQESGLSKADLCRVAAIYAASKAAMIVYGMGITQHRRGVDGVRALCNLLLLRGNVGRPGTGICPVRGHSNVQGQRTVGISEKPELVPLERLAEQYRFNPPDEEGLDTIGTVCGVLDGSVKAFIGLGGNFLRAAPDTRQLEPAWRKLELSVHVATRLNRSHLICAGQTLLLPCLGRLEADRQYSGLQRVTTEDSTARIHGSFGTARPASAHCRSEPAIVAGIAKATLTGARSVVPWDEWVADYGRIRDAIEKTYPDDFADFNRRLHEAGGFPRPNAARERIWKTESGKAEFFSPKTLSVTGFDDAPGRLRLITLRSNDQFNTTIYGYRDRFRGIEGTRRVVLVHPADIERLGFDVGDQVSLVTDVDDGVHRQVSGLRLVGYSLPEGCIAAYYPECNPLLPWRHHAEDSKVPAAKSIPVRMIRELDDSCVPAGPAPG